MVSRNKANSLMLVLAIGVAAVNSASAEVLYRSWRDTGDTMSVRVVAQVQVTPGYWGKTAKVQPAVAVPATPFSTPPAWHEPTYSERLLQVSVRLDRPAPLRPGEIEAFNVAATHTYGQSAISLNLTPVKFVWKYSGQSTGYVSVSTAASNLVTLTVHPSERQVIRPPNALAALRVGTGKPNEPLVIEFDDPGAGNDGNATTAYPFAVYRKRSLWPDKLIASGTYRPGAAAAHQRIVIEKGGPFNPGGQFLTAGTNYLVSVRVQKFGHDYTGEPSDDSRLEFHYQPATRSYSRDALREIQFDRLGR